MAKLQQFLSPPETPQDKEEADLASLEKTWGEEDMREEDEEKEEKDEEDKEEEDRASPKAPLSKHPLDPEEYFTTYVLQHHDGLSRLSPFLEGWAQHRYKEHSLRMPEPGLLDLRRVAKGMNMDYVFAGKKRLLSSSVVEVNRRPAKLYRVDLRWGSGCSGCWRIGSMYFHDARKRPNNHQALPKAIWLFLDMLHLIMLLAKRTNAKKDVMRFWFQEAKDYLMGMKKNNRLMD